MSIPPRKQTVLFVGDLSSICTEQHIRELFEVNGFMVVDIKMMGGKVTSNSYDYGFVELATSEEAEMALAALDGTFLCGRRLRVKWAAPNVKNKPNKGIINSVHVRFQSLQPGLTVNEETLLNVFEAFGVISDVSVKSCAMNPHNGLHDGYGFVHFPCTPEGVSVALKAVSTLSENPIVDNVHYSCEMSKNLLKLLQVQSQKRSHDAYAALNSHLQYSSRYNTVNNQNYALPGQGYMPGAHQLPHRSNMRRPLDPALEQSRLFGGEYGLQYQQQSRKQPYDLMGLMPSHLRPDQDEYGAPWSDQALTGNVNSVPLGYELGLNGSNLRYPEPGYSQPRYPEAPVRYPDARYTADMRLVDYRQRNGAIPPTAPAEPLAALGGPRRDSREIRPPAQSSGTPQSFDFNYSPFPLSQTAGQSLNEPSFRLDGGYPADDFPEYPYPVDEPPGIESANDDPLKSLDDINELLTRHAMPSTNSTRIY